MVSSDLRLGGSKMEDLRQIVAELVAIITTIGGIYFFIGFVVNLAQTQISSITGDTLGRARALQQGIAMVILLCIAVSIGSIMDGITEHFDTVGAMQVPQTKENVIAFWSSLAKMIVSAVAGISTTLLTVSAVFNGLGLQISKMIGLPIGIARSAGNLLAVVIGLALSITAVAIAQGILDVVINLVTT
jgi:hypothetical protein